MRRLDVTQMQLAMLSGMAGPPPPPNEGFKLQRVMSSSLPLSAEGARGATMSAGKRARQAAAKVDAERDAAEGRDGPDFEEGAPGASAALSWKTVQRALLGNSVITLLKFGVWWQTGSSAMLSEAIHTLADSGNQALLLAGLQQSSHAPDGKYQYGYGRAAFFWALISALGMFWTGAGVTVFHGGYALMHPEAHAVEMTPALWAVLAGSFVVDGSVLVATLNELKATKPPDVSMLRYIRRIRDPFVMAVLLEDFCACSGVLMATCGIGLTYMTGNVAYDAMASLSIGVMLGLVAIRLVSWNKQFLLGQAVDKETLRGIRELLYERPSVEAVYSVQSQWVGPSTFSYKAEVDFDGTYLAAHLEEKYAPLFMAASERGDVEVLMSWYAEDVTRLVELEVRDIEKAIRQKYPAAVYIELEPDSKYSDFDALPKDMSSGSKDFNAERLELDRFETIIEEELKEEEEERKLIEEQAVRAEEERKRLEEEEEAASQGDSHLHDGPDGAKHGKA